MKSTVFAVGDIVFDEETPDVLGIVTEVRERGITIVFEHGGRVGGPGLLGITKHRAPRSRVVVSGGLLGNRSWNREQSAVALLRRAGLR